MTKKEPGKKPQDAIVINSSNDLCVFKGEKIVVQIPVKEVLQLIASGESERQIRKALKLSNEAIGACLDFAVNEAYKHVDEKMQGREHHDINGMKQSVNSLGYALKLNMQKANRKIPSSCVAEWMYMVRQETDAQKNVSAQEREMKKAEFMMAASMLSDILGIESEMMKAFSQLSKKEMSGRG